MIGVRLRTGVPVSSAALIVCRFEWKVSATGRRSRESLAKSCRNGSWTLKLSIPAWSVGGDFAIVCWRQPGQAENEAKVFAILPNKSAWTLATGTTSAEAWPMFLKKLTSFVSGADRLRMTGVRWRKNGLKAAIAWLIEAPRPAKASPKPLSAVRELSRVALLKVEKRSSYSSSVGLAFESGIVSPAL